MSARGSELHIGHYTGPGVTNLWRMDSASGGVVSDLVGGLNLTFSASATAPGQIGNGINFVGPQVLYATTNSLKSFFVGSFTVEMWMRPRSSPNDVTGNLLTYSSIDSGSFNWNFNLAVTFPPGSPGKWYLYTFWNFNGGDVDWVDVDWDYPATLFDVDQWYHMAFRKNVRADGKCDVDAFVNGSRLAPGNPYTSLNTPGGENPDLGRGLPNIENLPGTTTLFVGGSYTWAQQLPVGYPGGPDGSLDGMLDDVRLSNFARTDRDILESYLKGL